MLNTKVINVLGQVNNITNKVILKYPNTVAKAPAGDILVNIPMSKLDNDSFEDIGLYDLGEFLNTFKLFSDDRTVEVSGVNIAISDGTTNVEYITDSTTLLQSSDASADIFDKTEAVNTVSEFILEASEIGKIKQASKVFKDLSDVAFVSQDGDMLVKLAGDGKYNSKSNSYSLKKSADTSKEFDIRIPVENFVMLPQSDYTIRVKYNQERDAFRVMFYSNDIEDFNIIMAIKK